MVGTNLKAETFSLMDQRTLIEAQMDAIIDRLCGPGGPGITGNLLDSEGFPRSDIDIHAVRSDRHRLAELRNDHKNLTNRIDQNLQVLHSAKHNPGAPSFPRDSVSTTTSMSRPRDASSMDVEFSVGDPFAAIDEITPESPAASDGLQLGDLVVQFGSVAKGGDLLSRLSYEAQSNVGKPVPVAIMRHGSPLTLTVTPRQWQGRGLLGCHFRIL